MDDRDEASFKEHFKTMPWVAMNFGNAEKKVNVCSTFHEYLKKSIFFVSVMFSLNKTKITNMPWCILNVKMM